MVVVGFKVSFCRKSVNTDEKSVNLSDTAKENGIGKEKAEILRNERKIIRREKDFVYKEKDMYFSSSAFMLFFSCMDTSRFSFTVEYSADDNVIVVLEKSCTSKCDKTYERRFFFSMKYTFQIFSCVIIDEFLRFLFWQDILL